VSADAMDHGQVKRDDGQSTIDDDDSLVEDCKHVCHTSRFFPFGLQPLTLDCNCLKYVDLKKRSKHVKNESETILKATANI
jgi:hypothetical protein